MANSLKQAQKEDLRQRYLAGGGIREIARAMGISRNAVRRSIRSEGLLPHRPIGKEELVPSSPTPMLEKLDLKLLEKMYSQIREPGPAKDFELQIKTLALEIGNELCVRSRVDVTRLELAISQYILYRRFFFASMDVSDKLYCGPYAKFHDKQAKAAVSWIEASNRALETFSRLMRELEAKAYQRGQNPRSTGAILQQQINVTVDGMRSS